MTVTTVDMDQLIRDAIDHEGPTRAPAGLAASVLSRTETMRQRRPLVQALDREAWPARRGSVADPATWRALRVSVALMLVVALLTTAAFIGARLTERTPRLDYPGTLTTVGTLSTTWEWPILVPFDDRRVLVTGFPTTAGALLAEIVDLSSGASVSVPWPNPTIWIEDAVRLHDGRVAVLAWMPLGSGPTGRSKLVIVDADGTTTEVQASLQPRLGAAMTLLDDGRVLLAGGVESQEATEVLGSAEIVDVSSGTVVPAGPLRQPRADAASITLADGRVLLAGGYDIEHEVLGPGDYGDPVARVLLDLEVFDPRTATFASFGVLPSAPGAQDPVRLDDHNVMILGQQDEQRCGRHDIDPIHTFIVDPSGDIIEGPQAPHGVRAATPLQDGTVLLSGHWSALGPAPGGCSPVSTDEYVEHPWIGTLDPVSGATRLSYDPFTGDATIAGTPSVAFGAATTMPDGRAILVTWWTGGGGEAGPPPSEVVVLE